MNQTVIMAVLLDRRREEALKVQEVLTNHGCIIKVRLGIHEVEKNCSEGGLILLHLYGTNDEIKNLETALLECKGVRVKSMEI